jgi:uncharacterized protein (TIGR03435 family)
MNPWTIYVLLLSSSLALSQPRAKVEFEVASIRPSAPSPDGMVHVWMSSDAGMLRYTSVSLRDCVRVAFDVKESQIQGPDWIGSTRFDIVAKLPAGSSESQIPEMLQAALVRRFKLTAHRETREAAVYALVIAKGAPALKPVGVPAGDVNTGTSVATDESGVHLNAPMATAATLAELISRFAQRPVIDATGLPGRYDFDVALSWETVREMQSGGGSIYDSLDRYGLKLELRKSAQDMLIVDRMEKTPTEN